MGPHQSNYQVVARNYNSATENRIHSDEVAKEFGFTGALVPGVAVFGHLSYLMVQRFGEDWLSNAECSVRFLKPVYHEDQLTVSADEDNGRIFVRCHNSQGTLLAVMNSSLPGDLPATESQEIFDAESRSGERVDITWDSIHLHEPFSAWHLQMTEDGNRIYTDQISDPLGIYRFIVHPHWLLSMANKALTREYIMPAWIHAGSEIRFRSLVKVGDTLTVNAVPIEKWERKGHEFVRLYVAYHREDALTTEVFLTAIFKVAS